jgi:trimethylamine--corrinoid protein Co-methyltransferase
MIRSNVSEYQSPQFRVLSDGQCQAIFLATLECLSRVGVRVQNDEGQAVLANAGAKVEGDIVRIPAHLVRQAIATTPPGFKVWGRDGKHEMHVAMDHVHFGPGPSCTYFNDPLTGERRRARRGDAGLTARVCDALANIDYVMGLSLFDDVTPVLAPVYEFAEMLANTTKPLIAWAYSPETLQDIYRIAAAAAGNEQALRRKPNFIYFTTYESPLKLAPGPVSNLLFAADHEIPSVCLGGPTIGLESPLPAASALVVHLASALAALTIVQTRRPGSAMAIGGVPSMMDMRTARPAYGSPEMSINSAAAVDLARFLGLPFMGTAGATESKALDAQAGIEAAQQVLLSALSGAPLVHDIGFLDCADIGSLDYLVLVDEIISMTRRMLRGIRVDPETIMLDLIEQVGPGGTFINQKQSVALIRSEAWIPSVLERNPYDIWVEKGSPQTADLVSARLRAILEKHHPEPLPDGVEDKIATILRMAEGREQNKN